MEFDCIYREKGGNLSGKSSERQNTDKKKIDFNFRPQRTEGEVDKEKGDKECKDEEEEK